MSRKPTIKLLYPDASTLAMQLTDAMIRRAPGKRILETTSEDKAGDGEGSLLDDLNSVRTSTGVEMTLTLEPSSMDYALQQLIRPNLTEEEKKSIFGEESTSADEMLPGSAPAEEQTAPDQEKQIEIGKIADADLRIILRDLVDAAQGYVQGGQDAWEKHIENVIETAIKEIDHRAGVIDLDETYNEDRDYSYKTLALFGSILATIEMLKATKNPSPQNALILYGLITKEHLKEFQKDAEGDFLDAFECVYPRRNVYPGDAKTAESMINDWTKFLYDHDPIRAAKQDPSWGDVEAEARKIGQHKSDETNETDDIELGLLNDIEDGEEGEK